MCNCLYSYMCDLLEMPQVTRDAIGGSIIEAVTWSKVLQIEQALLYTLIFARF